MFSGWSGAAKKLPVPEGTWSIGAGLAHRRPQRVRVPDHRGQATVEQRLRLPQRALGDGLRVLPRAVPTPRTRDRPRGVGPAGPEGGWRAGREARRVARRAARPRGCLDRGGRGRTDRRSSLQGPGGPAGRPVHRDRLLLRRVHRPGCTVGQWPLRRLRPDARVRRHSAPRPVSRSVRGRLDRRSASTGSRSPRRRSSRSRSRCADNTTSCCPGPQAPYSELSGALAWLLLGSVLAQLLSYASVFGVNLLATKDQSDLASHFITGLFIARIPLLLFQAVQAALLPKLAAQASAGEYDEFRSGMRELDRGGHRIVQRGQSSPRHSSGRGSARSCSPTNGTSATATSSC